MGKLVCNSHRMLAAASKNNEPLLRPIIPRTKTATTSSKAYNLWTERFDSTVTGAVTHSAYRCKSHCGSGCKASNLSDKMLNEVCWCWRCDRGVKIPHVKEPKVFREVPMRTNPGKNVLNATSEFL
eukprot:6369639-Amphidinium_carterae.1